MYIIEPRTTDIYYQVGKPVLPYCKEAIESYRDIYYQVGKPVLPYCEEAIGSFSIDDGYDSEIVNFKMT